MTFHWKFHEFTAFQQTFRSIQKFQRHVAVLFAITVNDDI